MLLSRDDEERFFLPFRDATSRRDAYGAGCYLDVEASEDGHVHIDFNLAYNTYGAYDDAFSCALPPRGELALGAREAGCAR